MSASCRAGRARILPLRALHAPLSRPARIAAAEVTGAGSLAEPFSAPCSTVVKHLCTVDAFPARYLDGLWANEHVPAYECPTDYPWLYDHNYVPVGTTIPKGVEINEDDSPWPVGIMILSAGKRQGSNLIDYLVGTATGFPWSSATNWKFGKHWYKVVLHCTDLANLAARG